MQRADGTPVIVLPGNGSSFGTNGAKTQRLPSDSTIARHCSAFSDF